ncbi:hypothetical protein [Vibrio owensii]|uniref:hypothetical protein n=1 Tax=Vibrio owensii TaxID=696485 RepID=UPI003CC5B7B5
MLINRVLLKANPEYFTLTPEKQFEYRVNFFTIDSNRQIFDEIVGNEHFGKPVTPKMHNDFSDSEYAVYNYHKAKIEGIGQDNVWLNIPFAKGNPLIGHETALDWDMHNQKLESEHRGEKGFDYKFKFESLWIRYIENDKLYYATANSLAKVITDNVYESAMKRIKEVYPYNYVKDQTGDSLLGYTLDGGIKTPHIHELRKRMRKKLFDIHQSAAAECESMDINGVWFWEDFRSKEDNSVNLVVPNSRAAAEIKWESFLNTIRSAVRDHSEILALSKPYIDQMGSFLNKAHADIEENFEPGKVVPIRRRRVSISPLAKEQIIKAMRKVSEKAETEEE